MESLYKQESVLSDSSAIENESKDQVSPLRSATQSLILHVLCVSFHHRNGPQVDFVYPPFAELPVEPVEHKRTASSQSTKSDSMPPVALPKEWSFLPFLCLPDGAHATDEEFIYFHLPPVEGWLDIFTSTIFGLACYRQIPASELINKTADVTRSTVQKAVVVLATQPFLGSVRSKLGMVTQAFFAQKDFSKLDILETLFDSLEAMVPSKQVIPDATLYMGISIRDLVYTFRHKTLQLFKLLLLGKRVLFFGQKVERLTCYQYSLVSLIPKLLRNLKDCGSSALIRKKAESILDVSAPPDPYQVKVKNFNMPLRLFSEGAVWLPYIPLQQIDVLLSPQTKSFLVGTSNSIFTHHSACHIDVVVNTDTGNIEIQDATLTSALTLNAADKKFIEEICKLVVGTWSDQENDPTMNMQMEFEGSDDDIRSRFESYLLGLLATSKAACDPTFNTSAVGPDGKPVAKPKDLLQDYNMNFVKLLQLSPSYKNWFDETPNQSLKQDIPSNGYCIPLGHPYQGTTTMSMMQSTFTLRLTELGKTVSSVAGPAANTAAGAIQTNMGKALVGAESGIKTVVGAVTDPQSQQKVQATASQLFSGIGTWYAQKKKEWTSPSAGTADALPDTTLEGAEEKFEEISLDKD